MEEREGGMEIREWQIIREKWWQEGAACGWGERKGTREEREWREATRMD